jgi:hypothetical protein
VQKKFPKNKKYTIPYPIARESFNNIKKSLHHLRIKPLTILLENGKAILTNPAELKNVIQILTVKEYFDFNIHQINIKRKLDFSSISFDYEVISSIYELYNKSDFFDALLKELPFKKLKIIPVEELILGENLKKARIDESFLFLYQIRNDFIIIWESIHENKATYIFKATSSNYQNQVQKLFEFICNITDRNKRDEIISNYHLQKELGFNGRILHENPRLWVKEINTFFLYKY